MRITISEEGQITIPKRLRKYCGFAPDVELELILTVEGMLIRKKSSEPDPIEAVRGIADGWAVKEFDSVDAYMSAIRGYDYAEELRKYNDITNTHGPGFLIRKRPSEPENQ